MFVHKYLPSGELHITYTCEVASQNATSIVVLATWQRPPRDLGYTTFMPGDHFTEYFYTDHWFNILRIDAVEDGSCRGWYCNITHPATITADAITYVDLFLDVWVRPDGSYLILDEDEFAAEELADEVRAGARAGLTELLEWVVGRVGPFQSFFSILNESSHLCNEPQHDERT